MSKQYKKIYVTAINWGHVKDNVHHAVTRLDTSEGADLAYYAEHYKYTDGWRVYVFTTKTARDALIDETLRKAKEGGE